MRISDWSSDVCSYDLKVPLAITAITSSELERSGIRDLQGVAATVPGLNLGEQLGVAKISLRGIGLESLQPGAEGSIAFHVDGVFISRSVAALARFYDIQQVEEIGRASCRERVCQSV